MLILFALVASAVVMSRLGIGFVGRPAATAWSSARGRRVATAAVAAVPPYNAARPKGWPTPRPAMDKGIMQPPPIADDRFKNLALGQMASMLREVRFGPTRFANTTKGRRATRAWN